LVVALASCGDGDDSDRRAAEPADTKTAAGSAKYRDASLAVEQAFGVPW